MIFSLTGKRYRRRVYETNCLNYEALVWHRTGIIIKKQAIITPKGIDPPYRL